MGTRLAAIMFTWNVQMKPWNMKPCRPHSIPLIKTVRMRTWYCLRPNRNIISSSSDKIRQTKKWKSKLLLICPSLLDKFLIADRMKRDKKHEISICCEFIYSFSWKSTSAQNETSTAYLASAACKQYLCSAVRSRHILSIYSIFILWQILCIRT